jgi:hypothetical protein
MKTAKDKQLAAFIGGIRRFGWSILGIRGNKQLTFL